MSAGRKNILSPYYILTNSQMNTAPTSLITNIQYLDNICIECNWTGNASGTFSVQASNSYSTDFVGNVVNTGFWTTVDTATAVTSPVLFDLNQLSMPYIRITYQDNFDESGSITTVADVAGSLNSKYFLINGTNGTNWYVWMNINSAGIDPHVAARTGISVSGSTNISAASLGDALRTALSACTSIQTVGGAGALVTFQQVDSGSGGSVADSIAAPTGFTFSYTADNGVLNSIISAKQV